LNCFPSVNRFSERERSQKVVVLGAYVESQLLKGPDSFYVTGLGELKAHSGLIEACPGVAETQPGVVKAHPEVVQAYLTVVQAFLE
jgi:hypothetical protein